MVGIKKTKFNVSWKGVTWHFIFWYNLLKVMEDNIFFSRCTVLVECWAWYFNKLAAWKFMCMDHVNASCVSIIVLKVVIICCVAQQVFYNSNSDDIVWTIMNLNLNFIASIVEQKNDWMLSISDHCWNFLCCYLKATMETSYVIT